MFFFNLVERKVRLFTNKQEFLTLLHLRYFRLFQNLSEETCKTFKLVDFIHVQCR